MPDVGSGKQVRAHTGLDIPGPLSLYRGDARTMRAAVPSSLRASEGTLQTTGLRGSREPLDFVSQAGGGGAWGDPGTCFQSRVVIRSGDTPASLLRAPAP